MSNKPISDLQKALAIFDPASANLKLGLLEVVRHEKLSPRLLQQYHQALLFILAYPQNSEVEKAAESEIARMTGLLAKNENLRGKLLNSGIAYCSVESAFSLTLTHWLCGEFPDSVSIHSFDEGGIHPKEILKNYLDESEFELSSDEKLKPLAWIHKASGTRNNTKALKWLVKAFNDLDADELIKDHLFESLKLFIQIIPRDKALSSSFGKLNTKQTYYHPDSLLRKFNEREIISKALPPEKKLNLEERKEIIAVSRIALMLLRRETDPITYCEENNLMYFELERGLSIALFSIDASRRLPLESYIGFMMFKNGYPMSYGGAWLFGKRALIGINIFEAFRGGESALVFANLIRTYKMAFGAEYFEVEPYQFGKNNPEGIKSGAFWFYHRFGFRPVDKELFVLCESEQHKISEDKTYRSSYETLKRFTGSNLYCFFGKHTNVPLNPAQLSRFISQQIARDYSGDRVRAHIEALQKLKKSGILFKKGTGSKKLAIFFASCFNLSDFNRKEKEMVGKMIAKKEEDEFAYIRLCSLFPLEKRIRPELRQFLNA